MFLALIGSALALHVTTYDTNPSYTRTPIGGLESLVVDPAVVGELRPLKPPLLADGEPWKNEAKSADSALVFTNPADSWAEFSINSVLIGIIGPYATTRIEGLKPGMYQLDIKLPTGLVRHFVIRRGPPPRAKIPALVKVEEKRLDLSDNVYFELDSAVIDPESHELLDAVASTLAQHTDLIKLMIEGHTDSRGNDDYNQKLSEGRAAAVREYLLAKGIAAERIASIGFGESHPVDTSDTEDAWEKNRRVEFTIAERLAPPVAEEPKPKKGTRGAGKPK